MCIRSFTLQEILNDKDELVNPIISSRNKILPQQETLLTQKCI